MLLTGTIFGMLFAATGVVFSSILGVDLGEQVIGVVLATFSGVIAARVFWGLINQNTLKSHWVSGGLLGIASGIAATVCVLAVVWSFVLLGSLTEWAIDTFKAVLLSPSWNEKVEIIASSLAPWPSMIWGLPGFPADTFWLLLGPIFSVLYTAIGGPHPRGMRKIRLIHRYNGAITGLCAGILLGTFFRMGIGAAILSLVGAIPESLAGTLAWRLPCTRRKPDAVELLHEETHPLTHYCPSFFEHFVRRYALIIIFAMVCVSAATW